MDMACSKIFNRCKFIKHLHLRNNKCFINAVMALKYITAIIFVTQRFFYCMMFPAMGSLGITVVSLPFAVAFHGSFSGALQSGIRRGTGR
jgi:hypothetical protein